jgi:hypothetical protein
MVDLTRDQQAPFVTVTVPLLEGLIALEDRRFDAAERPLGEAVALQERLRMPVIAADARVLLAAAKLAANQPDEALALFAPRLAECASDDTPGLLMWQGPPVAPLLRLAIARNIEAPFATRTLELLGVSTAHDDESRAQLL